MNKNLYVVCENIRSLYNVGSIFRTADALGVKKIYLGGYTGTPENPRLAKTALRAEQAVPWEHHRQTWRLVDKLKKSGVQIIALEFLPGRSQAIAKFRPRFPAALIVGNELAGVSPALLKRADAVVHIPMRGIKSSLNVATAFGIAGYQLIGK